MRQRLQAGDGETRLLRAAAAGDAGAAAAVRRRYQDRVFELAFRITGAEEAAVDVTRRAFAQALGGLSAEAADAGFAAQLLSAAHDAANDVLESGQGPEGLEGGGLTSGFDADVQETALANRAEGPLLEHWQEEVQAANAQLPPRHREVLALRQLIGLGYGEIAAIMGISRESVADLIATARIELRDELRGSGLAAEPMPSESCEQALQSMAMRDDAELAEGSDGAERLTGHLAACHDCRARLDAMQEARLSYSEWEALSAPPGLFGDAPAGAAAASAHAHARPAEQAIVPAPRPGADAEETTTARPAARVVSASSPATPPAAELRRRRRRDLALAGGWAAALLLGVLALLVGGLFGAGEDDAGTPEASGQRQDPPQERRTAAERPARRKPAKKRRSERDRPSAPQPVVQAPVRAAPVVVTPAPRPRRRARWRRRANPPRTERTRPAPLETTPPPRQQAPDQAPAPDGAAPAPPASPRPEEPAPPGCTNPGGQPVAC